MRYILSCLFASLLLATTAGAQDDAAQEFWTEDENGVVTHDVSGVKCPATLGDARQVEVLSYDRGADHLGISCHYTNTLGARFAMFIWRADVPELAGAGDQADAWNASVRRLLSNFPGALPVTVNGLGDDEDVGLYGVVFNAANTRGVPIQAGLWFVEAGDWVLRGDGTFPATTGGWSAAVQLRQTILDAKAAMGG